MNINTTRSHTNSEHFNFTIIIIIVMVVQTFQVGEDTDITSKYGSEQKYWAFVMGGGVECEGILQWLCEMNIVLVLLYGDDC